MKKIVIHNGVFHADEVMAVAILQLAYVTEDMSIKRTRDLNEFEDADFVIDVGGRFDGINYFDHHQNTFTLTRNNGIPYSSAGLIWRYINEQGLIDPDVFDQVDERLIQPIDAMDNGVEIIGDYDPNYFYSGQILDLYNYTPYTISNVISSFNPTWDEGQDFDTAFYNAVDFARMILKREIKYVESRIKAASMIEITDLDYVILDRFVPWQEVICQHGHIKFVIYPNLNGQWNLQCVPTVAGKTDQRKPLPEAWAGLQSSELQSITGLGDAIFCHKGRFIAGCGSKESCVEMIRMI